MTPDQNLSPSFLMICAEEYANLLGSNLACMMIHWDNREEEEAINTTLSTLVELGAGRWEIGLSGIKHPEAFAQVIKAEGLSQLPVEFKHNLLYSDYERYAPLHDHASFIAYGINAGGIKLGSAAYAAKASLLARGGKPDAYEKLKEQIDNLLEVFGKDYPDKLLPHTMNQLGMLYAAYHPGISAILLGPSRVRHMEDSFSWLEQLYTDDYTPLYEALKKLEP
jgi:aryl-alcohol dehydrogenase-like predicted oxidoreductase